MIMFRDLLVLTAAEGRVLLTGGGYRSGMLTVLQCTGQPLRTKRYPNQNINNTDIDEL